MKLKKLLREIDQLQVKGSKEVELSGISSNSKLVAPGNLFVARRGLKENGIKYIPEAISAGAAAIVTDMYDPTITEVVQLIHPDPGAIEGTLAAEYYQHPCKELYLVGITGTCGKTTTSFLAKSILDTLGGRTGLIGTVEYIIGENRYQASRTTPDVCTNHKLLRDMLNQKCDGAIMEVTSHALDQNRVDKIRFSVGVFTNLSQDHLDYHHTMEEYFNVKKKLFEKCDKAIINLDSPYAPEILKSFKGPTLTYGIDSESDLRATHIQYTSYGSLIRLNYGDTIISATLPLVGKYNIYNALAAVAIALLKGHDLVSIVAALENVPQVAGRLEAVKNSLGLKIFVDFAHKEDALKNVLESLRELHPRQIIVVFGCGGDRDRTKRSKMGAVCAALADFSIITNDNPRSEDPEAIAKEIVKGFVGSDKYMIELDRSRAIAKAIEIATPEDLILIAGKGHESYQIFAHHTVEFDDCKVAAELCEIFSKRKQHAQI